MLEIVCVIIYLLTTPQAVSDPYCQTHVCGCLTASAVCPHGLCYRQRSEPRRLPTCYYTSQVICLWWLL